MNTKKDIPARKTLRGLLKNIFTQGEVIPYTTPNPPPDPNTIEFPDDQKVKFPSTATKSSTYYDMVTKAEPYSVSSRSWDVWYDLCATYVTPTQQNANCVDRYHVEYEFVPDQFKQDEKEWAKWILSPHSIHVRHAQMRIVRLDQRAYTDDEWRDMAITGEYTVGIGSACDTIVPLQYTKDTINSWLVSKLWHKGQEVPTQADEKIIVAKYDPYKPAGEHITEY